MKLVDREWRETAEYGRVLCVIRWRVLPYRHGRKVIRKMTLESAVDYRGRIVTMVVPIPSTYYAVRVGGHWVRYCHATDAERVAKVCELEATGYYRAFTNATGSGQY